MPNEIDVSDINVGLRELSMYLEIFDDYVKNHYNDEKLNFANGVISMISMQHAKVGKLIEVAEKLESDVKGYKND